MMDAALPLLLQEDLLEKTHEDLHVSGKKNNTKGGWRIIPFIIGNDSCAELAVTSLSANLVVFLTTQFQMNQVAAAKITTVWSGANYLAPIVGAFIADSYLGRFWTIVLASVTYILALSIVTLITILLPSLRGSTVELVLLYLFLLLMVVGSSGIRSCSMPFGAEQFDVEDAEGRRKLQSFFNLYYFVNTVCTVLGLTLLVYLQNNVSWILGFGVATALMIVSTLLFLVGTKYYVYVSPEGSRFSGFAQVIAASIRKRNLEWPSDGDELHDVPSEKEGSCKLRLTDQFKCLNKAAIRENEDLKDEGSSKPNPWRLCRVHQIEELKSVISLLPIWSAAIVLSITLQGNGNTYMVYQAELMDRKLGSDFSIPAGSYIVFSLLAIAMWLPIYDRLILPLFRRLTKRRDGITHLERIGIGFFLSILTFVVAGVVEVKRKESREAMSGFWLLPQYTLMGLAEAFYAIGLIEFFYERFPKSMKSTAVALFYCSIGIGSLLSSVVITLVQAATGGDKDDAWLPQDLNRGHLEYFYWLNAGLDLLNLFYFIVCTRLVTQQMHDDEDSNRNDN